MGLIPDLAHRRAGLTPRAPALTDAETGEVWSFAELDAAAGRLAAVLDAVTDPGARIAVLCHNRPEFFAALFACLKSGRILAPLNWRQPPAELRPVADSIKCALVLHDDLFADTASALALPTLPLTIPDCAPLDPRPVDEDAPWFVLFTSGTTGTPKAVIQTPRMVLASALNIGSALGMTGDDRSVNYLPLFHTAGINLLTMPLMLWGGHSTVLRKFDAEALVALIGAGAVTQVFGVPAIYQALDLMDLSATDLAGVRGWACGGAALPEGLIRRFAARGAVIRNGFGMTETGPTGFLIDPAGALSKIGWVGKPQMLTEARIDGVPDGQPGAGELLLRGPSVTPGYLDNPEATRAAFDADGWLRSGDVAERDADGDYRIIDRIKDMYITGGENVYPAEIERVLLTHPAVLEVAVVGVPDPRWGETGAAFLIARPGQQIDIPGLTGWLRDRLAGYKLPRHWRVVADLPRTAAGKVRKPELRRMLA